MFPTLTSVQTWIALTIIDVLFAHLSRISFPAHAEELVIQIDTFLGSHGIARVAQALIYRGFALKTHISRPAFAAKTVDEVRTSSSVLTGFGRAEVDGMLAAFTSKTWFARANVVVNQIHAMSAVFARISLAVIDVGIATFARPTGLANAFVVE